MKNVLKENIKNILLSLSKIFKLHLTAHFKFLP